MGKHFLISRECIDKPGFRDVVLDLFNKECRPVNIALEAHVRVLPSKETNKTYYIHPDNLSEEISEKMKKGEIETASITFNEKTCIMDVCMGKDMELIMYLNGKEYEVQKR
jgi:hypothetical protein